MCWSKGAALALAAVGLAACSEFTNDTVGDFGPGFGAAVDSNHLVQVGYVDSGVIYDRFARDFARGTPDTVTFDFNSARLTPAAREILDAQFAWLSANRAARLQLAGHTDLVGGEDYNLRLGLARAEAVARYLVSRGIDRARLDTVATFGETMPVVDTPNPNRTNRRVVTTVAGIATSLVDGADGLRAQRIYRDYVERNNNVDSVTGGTGTSGLGGQE